MSNIDDKNQKKVDRRKALSMIGGGSLATMIAGVFSPSEFILKNDDAPKIQSNKLAVKREKRG
ncbi:hypothetical protein MJH12_13580 [bacterium]|nr:hypothetical protein [bacterium]